MGHGIPFGEVPAKRHLMKGKEGPCMLAIETEAATIARRSFEVRIRPRRNRSSPPLRGTNKEREEAAT